MGDIKNYLRETRNKEINDTLSSLISTLEEEGFKVEFGRIGVRTSYALLYTPDHTTEIVGYTFIKNIEYYKEDVGKLKALQQAIARKSIEKEDNRRNG